MAVFFPKFRAAHNRQDKLLRIALLVFSLFWVGYFALVWTNAFTYDPNGNLLVSQVNIWGDWAVHFTMTSAMTYRQLIPDQSPLIVDRPYSYPFANDLLSAVLIRLGMPFISAFIVPSFILNCLTILALLFFFLRLLRSRSQALLATTLFLLGGGLGFLYLIPDAREAGVSLFSLLLNPPHEYTNMEPEFIRWISVINSMFIPQRAFQMGFPMALFSLGLLVHQPKNQNNLQQKVVAFFQKITRKKQANSLSVYFGLGVFFGVLPLIHTHSFLACIVILGCWALRDILTATTPKERLDRYLHWCLLAGTAGVISSYVVSHFFSDTIDNSSFIKWFPGWYSRQSPQLNWWWFWFLNWSVVPILALCTWVFHIVQSIMVRKKSPLLKLTTPKQEKQQRLRQLTWYVLTYAPFLILFAMLNLALWQPFIWDNTKLLVWVAVGWSALAANGLWLLTKVGWSRVKTYQSKLNINTITGWLTIGLAALLFTISILSASIDTWRVTRFKLHRYTMYTKEELSLATWVRRATPPDAIWLTGDRHNHWLYNLTGRQPLMAYRGWIWTHGYDYHEVEAAVSSMYRDPELHPELFMQYKVSYVVIGPNEREVWHADEAAFRRLFPIVFQAPNYVLFQVGYPTNNP